MFLIWAGEKPPVLGVTVGVPDEGVESQCFGPPKRPTRRSLKSAHLNVVLEASSTEVDRETAGLDALDSVNKAGGRPLLIPVKELDEDARTSVPWSCCKESWRHWNAATPGNLVGNNLRPNLHDVWTGRFLEEVAMTSNQESPWGRRRTDEDPLRLGSSRSDREFIIWIPAIEIDHL